MKFSFVIADCDSVVSNETRLRCLKSLEEQTFKDFEVILCHDGARTQSEAPQTTLTLKEYHSKAREKVGGDNLRTPGMKMSRGEFIINGNIDNVYNAYFLYNLNKVIEANHDIGVFIGGVKMMGMIAEGGIHYDNPRDYNVYHLLKGYPPKICNIDIMNLVVAKKIYEDTGWWWSSSDVSDGEVYQNITDKYQYLVTNILVGEHY